MKPRTFDEYYSEIYGERWPTLRAAMTAAARKVALWNRFSQVPFEEATRGLVRVDARSLTQAFQPAERPTLEAVGNGQANTSREAEEEENDDVQYEEGIIDKPPIDAFGIKAYYLMDYASTYIVEQLQVGAFDLTCAPPRVGSRSRLRSSSLLTARCCATKPARTGARDCVATCRSTSPQITCLGR